MAEAESTRAASRLSRRAALQRGAGAALAASFPAAALPATSDPALDRLARDLRAAEHAWQRALAALAAAEARLFAARPSPPPSVGIPGPDGTPVVPARWSTLRRHLGRIHAAAPDRAARIAAARQAWTAYQAALAAAVEPAWYAAAQAAETEAAARIEALHACIAATPAQGWPGLRLKLAVLWARRGLADGPDRADWDLEDHLLRSALDDASRATGTP